MPETSKQKTLETERRESTAMVDVVFCKPCNETVALPHLCPIQPSQSIEQEEQPKFVIADKSWDAPLLTTDMIDGLTDRLQNLEAMVEALVEGKPGLWMKAARRRAAKPAEEYATSEEPSPQRSTDPIRIPLDDPRDKDYRNYQTTPIGIMAIREGQQLLKARNDAFSRKGTPKALRTLRAKTDEELTRWLISYSTELIGAAVQLVAMKEPR